MEVIGAVSSVVALVEATGKLAKGLTHLAQRWHNAPEEIGALALTTQELCIKFVYVQETVTDSPTTLVDDVVRHGLTQLVKKAQAVTTELSTLHNTLEAKDPILQKARWAVKNAKTAKAALEKVKGIEEGLSMWISFISLKGHSLSLQHSRETQQLLTAEFAEMKQMFSAIMITTPTLGVSSASRACASSPLLPGSAASASITAASSDSTAAVRRVAGGLAWQASSTWKSWGLHGTVIKSTKGRSVDYDVAVSLQLPMAWWFGINILKGQLSVSFPRQNTLTLRHPSYFAIARVLDYSHPFFKACESNDVAVVQEMLRNGEGRPTDEDPDGYDPLWYAAHHSSVEVLAELLENGANIDAKTGHMQNTLLEVAASHRHLDVLRTLLHRGASTDQCDRDGVDIHFFCWASKDYSNKGTSAIETANVLSEYMVLDSKCTWQLGTVLHVAAMFLDGHDIDTLISHSYDIEAKGDDDWTPIAYALEYGNASAYFALLAHGADLSYSVSSVESMLHRAVISHAQKPNVSFLPFPEKADYESIIKHILQHGHPSLDLTSPSNHELEEYPPSIHGRKVTPKQLAEAFGPKTEAWFLTLLRESGQPHHFTKEDKRRLHFLRLEGYARQGCVLGDDDEFSEDDEIYQCGNTTGEYGGGDDGGDDDDHEGNASSTHDGASDMGEEEQFWDAEQDLWSG